MFPELLFLAPLSALLIRASVAAVFAIAAYTHSRNTPSSFTYTFIVLEALAVLSLAAGVYAQVGALLGVLLAGTWLAIGRPLRPYPLSTTLLVLVMCLSILVTGPGAFAFDLPL